GTKKNFLKNLNWIDAFPNPQEYFGEVFTSIRSLLPETQNAEIQKTEISKKETLRKKKVIYRKNKVPVNSKKTFIIAGIAAGLIILGGLAIRLGSKENTGEPVVVPPVNEVVQDTVLKPVENKKDSVVLEKKVGKPTSENESNLSESTPAGKIERKSITFTEKETLISIAGEKIEAEVGYSFEGEFEDGKVVSGKLYDADKNIKKIIFPKRNF
ncbi:MAG: hypothetical protein LBB85_03620, partial [Dysgonamonadaceae bacterium]|nr:hypothetical protein [Dysgonamonadaceae bacterium]